MAYEIFTGQVPFRGDNPVATVLKQIEELPALEGNVPDAVVPVLAKTLAKDRTLRFASARGVAAALRLAREHMPRVNLPSAEREAGTAVYLRVVPRPAPPTESLPVAAGRPEAQPPTPPHQPATPASMAMAAVRLDPILKDLHSDDDSVRWRAVLALGAMGGANRAVLMALLDAMSDEDEAVRRAAVSGLGRLGPLAREAVPALIDVLRDDSLCDAASTSLVMIGLPAVPALLEAVQEGTSPVRWQAAEALTRIGRAS